MVKIFKILIIAEKNTWYGERFHCPITVWVLTYPLLTYPLIVCPSKSISTAAHTAIFSSSALKTQSNLKGYIMSTTFPFLKHKLPNTLLSPDRTFLSTPPPSSVILHNPLLYSPFWLDLIYCSILLCPNYLQYMFQACRTSTFQCVGVCLSDQMPKILINS